MVIPDVFKDAEILELIYCLNYFIEWIVGRNLHIKTLLFNNVCEALNHTPGKDPMSDFSKIPTRKHDFIKFLTELIKIIISKRKEIKNARKEQARLRGFDERK